MKRIKGHGNIFKVPKNKQNKVDIKMIYGRNEIWAQPKCLGNTDGVFLNILLNKIYVFNYKSLISPSDFNFYLNIKKVYFLSSKYVKPFYARVAP